MIGMGNVTTSATVDTLVLGYTTGHAPLTIIGPDADGNTVIESSALSADDLATAIDIAGRTAITDKGDGEILSGSFSPTLGKSIAFARVPAGAAGGALAVDIRGKALPVRAVKFPFVRDGQPCAGI